MVSGAFLNQGSCSSGHLSAMMLMGLKMGCRLRCAVPMQAPEKKGEGKKQLTAAEKRMRALKIGAAAAGGGALLAITGESSTVAPPQGSTFPGHSRFRMIGQPARLEVTGLSGMGRRACSASILYNCLFPEHAGKTRYEKR